jgi:uncharacterized protein (DUF983 family)
MQLIDRPTGTPPTFANALPGEGRQSYSSQPTHIALRRKRWKRRPRTIGISGGGSLTRAEYRTDPFFGVACPSMLRGRTQGSRTQNPLGKSLERITHPLESLCGSLWRTSIQWQHSVRLDALRWLPETKVSEMLTMVDRLVGRDQLPDAGGSDFADLRPSCVLETMWRGIKGRCPRCGRTSLFRTFLRPVEKCVACGESWQVRSADDFPPYIVILLLGHIIAPGMIGLEVLAQPPMWVQLVLWLPLVAILGAALIQPVKGGVMALQWWLYDGNRLAAGATEDEDSHATAPLAKRAREKDKC